MSDLSVMGLAEVLAASAAPRQAHQRDDRGGAAAQARCRRDRRFGGLLAQARPSSPRLRHPDHPLCRAAALGLAPVPRAKAQEARRSHHGLAALRGCRSSPNTAFPRTYVGHPAIESGVGSRRRPGLQGAARAPGGRDCPLRASRLAGRRSPPHASRVRRGAATLKRSLPGLRIVIPVVACRGRTRARP